MKIERVEVFGVEVPLVGEYKNAYKSKSIQRSAIMRANRSTGEPASDQHRRVIGRVGYSCATAANGSAARASNAQAMARNFAPGLSSRMVMPPL